MSQVIYDVYVRCHAIVNADVHAREAAKLLMLVLLQRLLSIVTSRIAVAENGICLPPGIYYWKLRA
jgi:hypothetical protein